MNILDEITRTRQAYFAEPEHCPSYSVIQGKRASLSKAIQAIKAGRKGRMAIIAELKFASPSAGVIRTDPAISALVAQIEKGGPCGISVLTEPHYFNGSFENLRLAASCTHLPLLMKDFLVTPYQVQAGRSCGASNILFIAAICDPDLYLPLLAKNHIEPFVEIHAEEELRLIERYHPPLVGINNRNLQNMKIDFDISRRLIPRVRDILGDKVTIVSESGVSCRRDVDQLYSYGADAFLVGSSIMEAVDVSAKLQELVG